MAAAVEPAQLRVEPSLDEVRELAREHSVIALRNRFIDDCETPVSAFLKLRGQNPQYPAFLLESAEQGQRVGRYSFIGLRPRKVVRWSLGDEGDPYAIAEEEVARHRQAPFAGMPPFAGGAVGYFGYDLVRTVEPLGEPNPDELGLPRGERALEHRQRLVRGGRLELSVVKAGALARVARRAGRLDEREHGVAVAVEAQRLDRLRVARGRALVPELVARAAEQVQLAGLAAEAQRLFVHVGERQDFAGAPILDDARNEAAVIETQ